MPRDGWLDVVKDHVAIHAQVMSAAELTLNARVEDLGRDDIRDALWMQRTLVKTWAMRGTLHLVAADELPELVGALAKRESRRSQAWLRYYGFTVAQMERLLEAFEEVLQDTPMTRAALVEAVGRRMGDDALAERMMSGWGTFLKPAAMRGLLVYGPDDGRNVTYVDPRQWLGREMPRASHQAWADVLLRFLRVMPGASPQELGRWMGLQPRPVLRLVHEHAAEVEVDGQRGLVWRDDLAELATLDDGGAGTLRLVGLFDPYVLSVTRTAVPLLPIERRPEVSRTAGWISACVLVDGVIAGTWTYAVRGGQLALDVAAWRKLSASERRQLTAEADRIGRFLDAAPRVTIGQA